MKYISTRDVDNILISPSEAIIKGMADDGGLYVPEKIPFIYNDIKDKLKTISYNELAYEMLSVFLTDFTELELKHCISCAYDTKFAHKELTPVVKVKDDYFLELFHGQTLAFKDVALSILPHLMKVAMKKWNVNKNVLILTSTSGDTGSAVLSSFANLDDFKVMVYYPNDGVSKVQKRQMTTINMPNVNVVGVNGNFDDIQKNMKNIINDKVFIKDLYSKGYLVNSANSINIGRLLPQIVYYFYSYAQLMKRDEISLGEEINFVVPTGNFGNILAGYYAKQMGLPVNKLICASNCNNVLYEFFNTNTYNIDRTFYKTISPSIDIVVSSNLERYLYDSFDNTSVSYKKLYSDGQFKVNTNGSTFCGYYASEQETKSQIKYYANMGYVIDPHTAVATSALNKYKEETTDYRKTIVLATASPFKFIETILSSLDICLNDDDLYSTIERFSEQANLAIPMVLEKVFSQEEVHKNTCEINEMQLQVKQLFNG